MLFGKSLLGLAIIALSAAPAFAGNDSVIGRLNTKTGTFSRLPSSPLAATKTYTGSVQVSMTIQIKSALPASQSYLCEVDISIFDEATASEGPTAIASVAQTASGGVLKCTVDIPYSWALASGGTTAASANWSVSEAQTTTGASRSFGSGLPSFNPATSATTKFSVTGEL
jgi:hypothetical protein